MVSFELIIAVLTLIKPVELIFKSTFNSADMDKLPVACLGIDKISLKVALKTHHEIVKKSCRTGNTTRDCKPSLLLELGRKISSFNNLQIESMSNPAFSAVKLFKPYKNR